MSDRTILDSYIGREVAVLEGTFELHGTHYPTVTLAEGENQAIDEMQAACDAVGLRFRPWLPNSAGTMDYDLGRVNVYIEKDEHGVYRVARASFG